MEFLIVKKIVIATSSVLLLFSAATASADKKVKFENDAQLQEVIKVGSKWECKWKHTPPATTSGTKTYTYETVSLNKITAKVVNSYCPDSVGAIESNYKKGKLHGVLTQSEPCNDTTKGHYKVYEKKDGSFYMKGPYSFKWTDGNTYKGNATCHPK
ncbi:MAG: hypothetical protein GKR92_07380 [Gammaproteobacteria bacterium]|nr:MAG: hypothetical protein GKR92_07380 [Gammaproteobacteria bacterium]